MKLLKTATALIIALLCACCTLIMLVQEDAWFKHYLQTEIETALSKNFDCTFSTEVTSVNLMTGRVTLKNIRVTAREGTDWYWNADQIKITIAPFASFRQKKAIAALAIKQLSVHSNVQDGQLAILPHLRKLITPAATRLPFEAQQLTIQQGACSVQQANMHCSFTIHAQAELHKNATDAAYRFRTVLDDGMVTHNNKKYIDAINGTIEGSIALRPHMRSAITFNNSCNLLHQPADDALCKWYGTWSADSTTLQFATNSQQLQGQITLNAHDNQCTAEIKVPLAYLLKSMGIPLSKVCGSCSLSGTTTLAQPLEKCALTIAVDDVSYQKWNLAELHTTLTYQHGLLRGPLTCTHKGSVVATGSSSFDSATLCAQGTMTNKNILSLPESWQIPAENMKFSFRYEGGEFLGDYQGIFQHATHQCGADRGGADREERTLKGILHITGDHLILQGAGNHFTYDILGKMKPRMHLEYADCFLHNEPVLQLASESDSVFTGNINYPLIRFVANACGINLPGQGNMHIKGTTNHGIIALDFAMRGGNIRLPYSYNLLRDVYGTLQLDTTLRTITLNDLSLNLHKGTISLARAKAYFNDDYELTYLSAPCTINNCFLGMKKDLFALVSGALTFEYKKNKPAQLNGFIALDRSHIRNNILSEEFFKNIFKQKITSPSDETPDLALGIHIMTCSPLRVKTPFLEAAAQAQIKLGGTIAQPAITGDIALTNGTFLFPYKPLLIKRGKIYFLPHQIDDPIVDILAENNIRKYSVRMTVDGTAKNSRISFDATPNLQEEQIIALLLGGSEDGSLFLAMPHSVMNSIEKLIFGPAESTSQFQRGLKNLFSPLKNLRITPSFSDQTARGGLRGSLVIDVNDRLRAVIEHNFSLPEDVVIQVEYDLSDDARIRAIKDERGDLGAELEGRWKF